MILQGGGGTLFNNMYFSGFIVCKCKINSLLVEERDLAEKSKYFSEMSMQGGFSERGKLFSSLLIILLCLNPYAACYLLTLSTAIKLFLHIFFPFFYIWPIFLLRQIYRHTLWYTIWSFLVICMTLVDDVTNILPQNFIFSAKQLGA